jgi:hypothetical protein
MNTVDPVGITSSAPMAERTIHEFSAPSNTNVPTGPTTTVGDGNFELMPALINMVQANPFSGKPNEDGNAHLQHFLEVCRTFTIRGVTNDAIRLCLFPFSLLGKAKQWFYVERDAIHTWDKCSKAFLTKFFPVGKTNVLRARISGFQQQNDESMSETWELLTVYFGTPNMFITLWFGFVYGTNPPLGTLII